MKNFLNFLKKREKSANFTSSPEFFYEPGNFVFSNVHKLYNPALFQPFSVSRDEIENVLQLLKDNEKEIYEEILRSYAYQCFVLTVVGCRIILELKVNEACRIKKIPLFNLNKKGKKEYVGLIKKIKKLRYEEEFNDIMTVVTKSANEYIHNFGNKNMKQDADICLSIINKIIIHSNKH